MWENQEYLKRSASSEMILTHCVREQFLWLCHHIDYLGIITGQQISLLFYVVLNCTMGPKLNYVWIFLFTKFHKKCFVVLLYSTHVGLEYRISNSTLERLRIYCEIGKVTSYIFHICYPFRNIQFCNTYKQMLADKKVGRTDFLL